MVPIRLALAALAFAALSGCMTAQDIRLADDHRCRGYGFRPGSDAFSKCLQDIDLDRSADRRAFLYGGAGPGFGMGFGYGYGFRRW
ncbi:hypothetical protein [Enterovirga rhinocerotis]|uniref:Lipoprotein n=1 Tax=Enterovirga rhinocerotis TaxID=1339210 RepID=A0A4R7BMC2_9HYPH|nr:hypothetical protein [Enterovirga rhinocerotis]TDR85425.1 hypothetical protein EV668_4546 [Enterovirga rhinocerotis]